MFDSANKNQNNMRTRQRGTKAAVSQYSKYLFHKIFLFISLILIVSCGKKSNNKVSVEEDKVGKRIEIKEHDISRVDYSSFLKMKSFTRLSNDVPVGNVQRAIIKNNKLYIADSQPKIICFDIESGEIEFEISKMGKGPGEFITVTDFLVNEETHVLMVYCSRRRKLIKYSTIDGKFIIEYSIDYAPLKIASIGSSTVFYNPYKLVPSNDYNYILLISDSKDYSITSKVFAHDPILSSYMYRSGGEFPFFYNAKELFFLKRFENIVYSITDERISPVYSIVLPNYAPMEFWKTKPDKLLELRLNIPVGLLMFINVIIFYIFYFLSRIDL